MASFEAFYGRPCRSLICWTGIGDPAHAKSDRVRDTTEKVVIIRSVYSRHKVYKRIMPIGESVTWSLPLGTMYS